MVKAAGSTTRKEEREHLPSGRTSADSAGTAPRRILLVDDDHNVLNALRRLFGPDEWEVWMATDEPPARELLSNVAFDIVVSDQRMPGGTGLELCAFLRDLEAQDELESTDKKFTPFVLLTALPEQVDLDRASRSRPDVVMGKPWDGRALLSELRKLVQRHQPAHVPERKQASSPRSAIEKTASHDVPIDEPGDDSGSMVEPS